MAAIPVPQACKNCAKARRRCGKQRPQCLRCQTRGQTCHYPPSKPLSFIAITDEPSGSPETTSPCSDLVLSAVPSPLALNLALPIDALQWFAAPQTWSIDASPTIAQISARFTISDFDFILEKVLGWLTEWVETGSCSIIHRHLYIACFPPAIQDAYMTLSAYMHRTPINEAIVRRIIVEKAENLVRQGLIEKNPNTTDVLDNLSRVQALLIYQVIGFYDLDIRLRALAGQHIPVLESWAEVVMQQTSSTILTFNPPCPSPSHHPGNFLWYSWILSESVRRIWLVVGGLQGLYKSFTNPDPDKPCIGGTVFTSRCGFWEASSAQTWEKECTDRYAGLVRLTETDKMFAMVPKEEISDFAKVVLQCTFGKGWCEERWGE